MERELSLGQQKILFDREATDWCGCPACKNYASQREKIYPGEFLQFLQELAVNPRKEWEAFDYDFNSGNLKTHLYGGWFLFVGELIAGADKRPEHTMETFSHWFTTSFAVPALPKDMKICAVEFLAQVPWVVAETDRQHKGR
jgi:hypothetical protein